MSDAKGIALITGSAQGLGRSIALRLARDGFDIALNDVSSKRDQPRAVADDVEKLGRKSLLVPADVTAEGGSERGGAGGGQRIRGSGCREYFLGHSNSLITFLDRW